MNEPSNQRPSLLLVRNLRKSFSNGGEALTIFKDLNLTLARGEIVALVGPSGAGKSTLLQMIGLLDTPSEGQIILDGRDVSSLDDGARTVLRRTALGFVYQFHHLLPEFTALENVMIPQMITGIDAHTATQAGQKMLSAMGLSHRLDHRPARLSGGEQQRVAIARALINRPRVLLADEPTGNLDPQTARGVFDVLLETVRGTGAGAIIATHNIDLAERMDRIIELKQGRILSY
jgi:lipoprotein-releasing system ATP-binding protein